LVLGHPGAGKTTLGLQFLLEGVRRGESVLYVSLSETTAEVTQVAESHGWSLAGVKLFELDAAQESMGRGDERSIFDPAEVELRETSSSLLDRIRQIRPQRVVFDSLSELELMAGSSLVFRRELLVMKRLLMDNVVTALLLSDSSSPDGEQQIQSLVHGIVCLEERTPEYGGNRRRLRVRKLRGTAFRGGFHDFRIEKGGVRVFPRLVARDHATIARGGPVQSGVEGLDALLGDGIARGTSVLVMGPAGAGKSTLVAQLLSAALAQGETAAMFLFEENMDGFLDRAEALGMPLRAAVNGGRLRLEQINPAELSPGEFSHLVRECVEEGGAGFVGIDSLNGYIYAMPDERYLTLHIHELLTYLGQRGVMTALVMAQHGLLGQMNSPADVTYVADALLLLRFFEARGSVRRGISMLKNRAGPHESAIRELQIRPDGLHVGPPLAEFQGVLAGVPSFVGQEHELMAPAMTMETD
jgi:circadian clock protein KaiC